MDKIICHCKQVSKNEIEKAISDGAKTLKDIQEMTGACTGNDCKEMNPSGKCCSSDINAMLPVPKFKMASTCGCGHC